VILCCLCTFLTGISLSAIATNGAMKVSFCCTFFAYCTLCLQLGDCWVKFLTTYGWINLLFFSCFSSGWLGNILLLICCQIWDLYNLLSVSNGLPEMTALLAKGSNKRQYFSVCTSTVIN
jgi:hypothetical protein